MAIIYFALRQTKRKIAALKKTAILCFLTESVSKEKHKHEKQSYYPSAGFNLFNVAAEKIDYGVGKQTESSIQNRDFWGLIFSVGSEGWKGMPDYGVMRPDRRHAALCGSVFCKMEESS